MMVFQTAAVDPERTSRNPSIRGFSVDDGHKFTAVSGLCSLCWVGPNFLSRRHAGRLRHDPLGWKAHRNRGSDINLALQAQRSTMQLGEGLGERQTEASPLVFAIQIAVDLLEWGQRMANRIW